MISSLLSQCYQRKKKTIKIVSCRKGLFEKGPPGIYLLGREQTLVLPLKKFECVGKAREFKTIHNTEVPNSEIAVPLLMNLFKIPAS